MRPCGLCFPLVTLILAMPLRRMLLVGGHLGIYNSWARTAPSEGGGLSSLQDMSCYQPEEARGQKTLDLSQREGTDKRRQSSACLPLTIISILNVLRSTQTTWGAPWGYGWKINKNLWDRLAHSNLWEARVLSDVCLTLRDYLIPCWNTHTWPRV